MDQSRDFFSKHQKPIIFILIVIAIILIAIPIIILISRQTPSSSDSSSSAYNGTDVDYYTDKASGKEFGNINQEPEETAGDIFTVIGLDILIEMGYTTSQYDVTYNTIKSFFSSNYPNISSVSYQKDSFRYNSENTLIAYLEVIPSGLDETFLVTLDNQAHELTTLKVTIEKL